MYRMLKSVNTTGMEEIDLYIEVVRVRPQVNQYVGAYINLLVRGNDNVVELDYGCGPSNTPTPDANRCEVCEDDEDCEDEEANNESDEDGDDESNGNIDVKADGYLSSFHTLYQVLENKQGIYISVDATT